MKCHDQNKMQRSKDEPGLVVNIMLHSCNVSDSSLQQGDILRNIKYT